MGDLPEDIIAEYEATSFSVKRTSGAVEENWCISRKPHMCEATIRGGLAWAAAHAFENRSLDPTHNEWKVWLYSNAQPHTCGWRRISTIWPSHLTTDTERNAWRLTLKARLDSLRAVALLKESTNVYN